MTDWEAVELGRVVLAFAALMYGGIWVQVWLFHRGGAFRHWAMYVPVILTPMVIVGALLGVVQRSGIWGWLAVAMLTIGILDGVVGLVYHLRGAAKQIGGLTVRNLIAGPPPVLPLAYALIGILGLIGIVFGAFPGGQP